MLLLILAIAGADPPGAAPEREVQYKGFDWTEHSVTWTEIPDPDPHGILPPIKGLRPVEVEPGRPRMGSNAAGKSAFEAERKANEELRRAQEAIARTHATVRAAGTK